MSVLASYMGFHVVATSDCAADAAAVAVPGTAVVVGGGAFHRSTQQQPRVP